MKKIFTLMLTIVVSMGMMSAAVYSGTCGAQGDNLTWSLNTEDGVLNISGTGEMKDYAYTTAPWHEYRNAIISVIIGEGVTSIGSEAFSYCSSLSSVTISKSVTKIGSNAFLESKKITFVNISDIATWCAINFERAINQGENTQYANPLYHAGNLYLNNTLVENLVIPNGVTEIGFQAFAYCTSITSVTIPEGVESLGKGAFLGCSNLSSIKLPTSLTDLGTYTFYYCTALASIEIPNNVTTIGEYTFYNCTGLTSVVIPSSVTYIGYGAFDYCKSLTSFTDSATTPQSMDTPCFTMVTLANTTLYVPAESIALYKAYPNWAQFGTIKAIEDESEPQPCIIASGKCGENLTWELGCDSVLTISGTGDMIDFEAFQYNATPWPEYRNTIKSVIIGEGITRIGNYAFYYCHNIISVDIPNSVTSIGMHAFRECNSLISVTIPDNVTSIGQGAFEWCKKLTSFVVTDNNQQFSSMDGVLFSKDKTTLICFPISKAVSSYVIPNSVTSIGLSAFAGCESLTYIEIPNSVISIRGAAFAWCRGLTSIAIPNSVTSIDNQVFYGCSNLTTVEISNSVTIIDPIAFSYCPSLTSFTNYAITPQSIVAMVFENVDLSTITLYVPAESIEAYQAADVWKEFGTIKAIGSVSGLSCTEAIDFDTVNGNTHQGGDALWYRTHFYPATIPDTCDIRMYLTNMSAEENFPAIELYFDCIDPTFYGGIFRLDAYEDAYFDLDRDLLETLGWPDLIIKYSSTKNSHIRTKLIPAQAQEAVMDTIIAYVCDGEEYLDTISYTTILIEKSMTWNDTVLFRDGLRVRDSITMFQIHPLVLPDPIPVDQMKEAGMAPTLVQGMPLDVETSDALLMQYYRNYANMVDTIVSIDTVYWAKPVYKSNGSLDARKEASLDLITPYTSEDILDTLLLVIKASECSFMCRVPYVFPVEQGQETPCLIASGTCGAQGDNLTWTLTCDSVLTISGTGEMTNFAYTTAPWYEYRNTVASAIISEGVTSIGTHSLQACQKMTSVSISNSVTSIGDHAFWGCYGLTTIIIPKGVIKIGRTAFTSCPYLLSFDVAADNPVFSSVDGVMFNKDKTTLVRCPEGKPVSYSIPDGTTTIGSEAFYGCAELTSVTFPESVKSIKNFAFGYCRGLTNLVLPNSLDSIGTQAFQSCGGITTVVIPNNVTYIGSSSFAYCDGLTIIEIPANVSNIGSGAFKGCNKLVSINVVADNPNYSGENGVLFSKDKKTLVQYPAGKSETSYSIPSTVENISGSAFSGCSKLINIVFPNSVTSIGGDAFEYCKNLTSVEIPNTVRNIGVLAFYTCSNLSSVVIGSHVTTIGRSAFNTCSNLNALACKAIIPPTLGSDVFKGVEKSIPVYVPAESVDAYKAAEGWKEFGSIIAFEAKATTFLSLNYRTAEVEVGTTITLIEERDGNDALTWSTSDSTIATVTNGVVTAIKEGTVTITASANGISDTCTVMVKPIANKTIAEFIAAQGGKCLLTGLVGKIDNYTYGNFNFTDSTGTIYVYGLLTPDGESKKFSELNVAEGDTLTVIAETYKLYNDKPEVVNAIFVEVHKGSGVTPTPSGELDINYAEAAYYVKGTDSYWEIFAGKLIEGAYDLQYPVLIMDIDNTDKTHFAGEFNVFNTVLYMSDNDSVQFTNGEVSITCVKPASDTNSGPAYSFAATLRDEAGKEYAYTFETKVIAYDPETEKDITLADTVSGGVPGLEPDTISIAEALQIGMALDSMATSTETYTIEGYVINAGTFSSKYKYQTWYMADDPNTAYSDFQAYQCYPMDGADTTAVYDGSRVRMTGQLQKYYNRQTATYVVEMKRVQAIILSVPEIDTITVAEALAIGEKLAVGATNATVYTIRGYVSSIEIPYDEQYKDQSFYIADDISSVAYSAQTGGFFVYRGKPADGMPIKEGAFVELTATIKKYSDAKIENAESNVLVTVLKEAPECRDLAGACGENLTWTLNTCDSALAISGTGAMYNYSKGEAPWSRFGVTSVNLGKGLTAIGKYDLYACYMPSIIIPASVTSIAASAFSRCPALTDIFVEARNSQYSSIDGVLYSKDKKTILAHPIGRKGAYEIPDGVDTIGVAAFNACRDITSITLPNSATTIKEAAFFGCGISSMTIPASVDSIERIAFVGCMNLTTIVNHAVVPQKIDSTVFEGVNLSACALYVPAESVKDYQTANVWKDFGSIIPMQAEEVTEQITDVETQPQDNSVIVTWPVVASADTYTLEIKKNGELICTLTFSSDGRLMGIAFAPARNGGNPAPAAVKTDNGGLRFTVTGLNSGTQYNLDVIAKDAANQTIKTYQTVFTTTGTATGLESIQMSEARSQKILRDGQILILRGGKAYNVMGAEVR